MASSTKTAVERTIAIDASPEDVVRDARRVCTVDGFRTRSPDLVEVFRALTAETRSS